MTNTLFKTWLSAVLCLVAIGSTAALAEADSFYLGNGHNGALAVTTSGTIINNYAPVTASVSKGTNTLSVGACIATTDCFGVGDLVIVLQTTGLSPPLDISTDQVGRWEFARVQSFTSTSLTFTANLLNDYAANLTQVIRVPEYTTVTLADSTRSLTATPWNGSAGGVLAFLATGAVDNSGTISADATGFQGGQVANDTSGKLGCTGAEAPASGARKGEGIDSASYGSAFGGRNNAANGGGGGVCFKSGGGGGGNFGAGGMGGRSRSANDGARLVGGLGGAQLTYSLSDHMTLGGGGGAGHSVDGTGKPGGRGGGIIFIRAKQLLGTTGIITSSGDAGGFGATDAGSGGGAGGSIYLRFADTASCDSVSANGGGGGNANATRIGPGGGGGGGRILFQAVTGGSCINPDNFNVIGASPGNQIDNKAPGGFPYGATYGDDGDILTLAGGQLGVPPPPKP